MARVVAWPPEALPMALGAVDRELEALEHQASRFRGDQAVARILTIQPAFRAARDDELCLSTCEKQTVTSSG
jgi:hypothetical protein